MSTRVPHPAVDCPCLRRGSSTVAQNPGPFWTANLITQGRLGHKGDLPFLGKRPEPETESEPETETEPEPEPEPEPTAVVALD